jgi:DNA-binding transcriptional ArsR family regulator
VASHPLSLIATLADEDRLRALAALLPTGAARSTEGVAEQTGLTVRAARRALSRLESGGLVSRDGDGAWRPHVELLREVLAAGRPGGEPVDHGVTDPASAAVLRAFMPHGRLETIPAARGKRLVVLDQIATVFEPGRRYAEHEVNALLTAFHPDYAALRRYLVDEGFLAREEGTYWRVGGTVDV